MPQIMIDTTVESAESLRLLAVLLTSYASLKDAQSGIDRSAGLSVAATAQAATAAAARLPESENCSEEAATIFAKHMAMPTIVPQGTDTNVVQLFPGAPTLPAVTSVVTLPASGTHVSAPVAGNVLTTAAAAGVVAAVSPELDAAGIPWDARIHQSNRNKKTDGTWMLKRGLDKTLAASVLAELTAAKLANVPVIVHTDAGPALPPPPVTLPPPPVSLPVSAQLPAVANTVDLAGLPPPPSSASLPAVSAGLPAAPALPAVLSPVQRFSAMMVKINAAKTAGAIDQNMIDEAHKALGLPQLQLAITQPDKIPLIEAALGL